MTWLAFALAGAALVIGLSIAPRLRSLPTVKRQLMALALLAIVLTLGPLLLFSASMFRARLFTTQGIAVIAVGAASMTVALVAASSLQRAIMRALRALSLTASSLSAGDLSVRAAVDGPEEIQELARSFNRMADNIGSLVETRREMTEWISHDLGAPVTQLNAMLEAVEDGVVEPGHYLVPMREQVGVMKTLIADLLEVARIDAGRLDPHMQNADLRETIEASAAAVTAAAQANGTSVVVEIAPEVGAAWCDPVAVERVMLNLLTNAVRHVAPNQPILVRAWITGDEVRIAVENRGEWIGEPELARIFDPFWRGEITSGSQTPSRAGAGLGLTIARGLVTAQGGLIWAENRPEGGVRFTFSLRTRPTGT